ncbi:hypothetical protein [Mucilaginibacter litoreus]
MHRYIIVPIIALTFLACKQRDKAADNEKTDSVNNTQQTTDTANTDLPGDNSVPLAQLIVPGVSLGQTALNESSENVIKRLGQPDGGDAAMGKSVSVWYADHNKKGYATHMFFSRDMGNDDTARVKDIRISSPAFKINTKLYTGVLLKNAEAVYKLRKVGAFTVNNSERNIFDDAASGIAFDADRSGTITGIMVHEKGKTALPAYMAFFDTVKQAQ